MIEIPDGSEIEVWWIPQVPMEPFTYVVDSVKAGYQMIDMLAMYDLFQLEKNIKPDYSNTGGLRWRHQEATGGEWWDLDEDDFPEVSDIPAKRCGEE